MELESLIEEVKNGIGAIIQKPKMTDKLLQRPPLRFLHDIVAAVTAATGFAEGLFNEQELDFATLTEKKQKIDYLDKIFKLVGICKVNSFIILKNNLSHLMICLSGRSPSNGIIQSCAGCGT